MWQYVVRQMIQRLFILLVISFLAFVSLNAMSDPIDIIKSMDPHITQQQIDIYKRNHGLDKPTVIRYFYWFKNAAFKGDFGISRAYKEDVFPLVMGRIPNTMYMQAIVLLIIVLVAIPLGIFSAVHQYSTWDYILTFFAFTGVSLPTFWVGLVLILWLGIGVGLPFTGMYSDFVTYGGQTMPYAMAPWFVKLGDRMMHLILPVLTVSLLSLAGLMRYTRSALLEVIRQDYVRTARAKGVIEKKVIYSHALRNAMIPIATILIQSIPTLFAGSLIVEQIFGWPGVGKMVYDAVLQKDYNLAMMDLMFLSFLTVIFTLIADISYAFLDPRITYR
jgi:peptide/nickel transport system permease protein